MKRKLICPICGKEFVTDKNAKRYCSVKCRKKANSKPKPMTVKEFECNWCGKKFLSERRKKYCCKECRLYANGRLIKRKKVKQAPVLSLDQVAILSREAGLSYGQYVQKYNL